jgi:hypothetical protein
MTEHNRPVFKAKSEEPKAPEAPETADAANEDYAVPEDPTMGPSAPGNSPRGQL